MRCLLLRQYKSLNPVLKDSKDLAMMIFFGSWFHILMTDRKNSSYTPWSAVWNQWWCPLVNPVWLNWGGGSMTTRELKTRYIIVALILIRPPQLSLTNPPSLGHYRWGCCWLSQTYSCSFLYPLYFDDLVDKSADHNLYWFYII